MLSYFWRVGQQLNSSLLKCLYFVVAVQSPSCVQLFTTPWTDTHQVSLSLTISWSLPKFMLIVSVMPSSHLILYCPLPFLPLVFPRIRVFSNVLVLCVRQPKYWSFSISSSNEQSGLSGLTCLISLLSKGFILAVQGVHT